MPKPGPRTTYKYSEEFKATAVRLRQILGVQIQEVAASLYIHPFMLSRWRKQAREGLIVTRKVEIDKATAAELKALRKVKRDYQRLKLEHEILKNGPHGYRAPDDRNTVRTLYAREDSGRQLLGGFDPVKKPGPGEAADRAVAAPSGDPV